MDLNKVEVGPEGKTPKLNSMLLSDIRDLLRKKISTEDFQGKIQKEMEEYRNNVVKKQGYSSPIYLDEDIEYHFTQEDMQQLASLDISDKLNHIEMSYLVDALLFSEKTIFGDDKYLEELERYVIN